MSNPFFQKMHRKRKRRDRNPAQLAAQLAPLEEQKNVATQERGAIVVDSESLSPHYGMENEEESRPFRIEPVVLVILILMLGYIAFIAWQISQMPA